MISETENKWDYKVEMTIKEMFNPPLELPYKGTIILVRELEKILGKEAHRLKNESEKIL